MKGVLVATVFLVAVTRVVGATWTDDETTNRYLRVARTVKLGASEKDVEKLALELGPPHTQLFKRACAVESAVVVENAADRDGIQLTWRTTNEKGNKVAMGVFIHDGTGVEAVYVVESEKGEQGMMTKNLLHREFRAPSCYR